MPHTYATPPAQPAVPRPPDPALVAEVRRILCEALGTVSRDADRAVYHAALTEPLAQFCKEAKRRALRAEELLIVVKCAWSTLPLTRWWRRDADTELLSIVITVCIEQFFLDSERARSASS